MIELLECPLVRMVVEYSQIVVVVLLVNALKHRLSA